MGTVELHPPAAARPNRSSTAGLVAWALYDWANSAYPTVIQTFVFSFYFTAAVAQNKKSARPYGATRSPWLR